MVIVDTSAWVDFFRRDGNPHVKLAVKGLLDAYQCALCGPVEMEFLGGAHPHEIPKIRAGFDILPYVRSHDKLWRLTAANFEKLRVAGFTVPWNDILISTLAQHHGHAVYAHDKHFPIMADVLGVSLYQPGYNGTFNADGE